MLNLIAVEHQLRFSKRLVICSNTITLVLIIGDFRCPFTFGTVIVFMIIVTKLCVTLFIFTN